MLFVEIKYKPEKDADDLVEVIPFLSKEAAQAFADRQGKHPNVIGVKVK